MMRPHGHEIGSPAATAAMSDWERRRAVGDDGPDGLAGLAAREAMVDGDQRDEAQEEGIRYDENGWAECTYHGNLIPCRHCEWEEYP
jgi:hypothetical protein